MIKNLFKKDIFRQIEGVIKADNLNADAIFQEVDEYVITKEIHKRFDEFFSEYSSNLGHPTSNIGCWISGHFGSGKSHLLKILSYILSSDEKYDKLIKELFLTKIDDSDFELKRNIEKALNSPSETILFNIEQKTENSENKNVDTILEVFVKVFNEFRGYYPKIGYIAKFERDLDKRGKFHSFKEAFQKYSNQSWESGREMIFLETDNVAKALSEIDDISFESAKDVIYKYEQTYSISVEEFAKEVKEYISHKPKDFRFIFCVDEIGQFIGDNTKLMLNLQTIVESLAVECQGQAWVIVTSQSAVKEIVDSNVKMDNDFSKILGRFKLKLNLTSQNANEVIQKRLLEKKDEVKNDLKTIYKKVENSLKSILKFEGKTRDYKSYKNESDFIKWYPFIPYQLDLFQSVIKSLSEHNFFQGRHQSTGERSMLDVVQYITKKIADRNIGSLITFDKFFDGISSIIRADFQTEINKASDVLNEFELKVLKVLFLIKYIKEFESNLNNIAVLLVDDVNVDFYKLKEKVKKALDVLIKDSYINKIGGIYEYLTNLEKDIQVEINSFEIEEGDINAKLSSWIYDDIIKLKKIRYKTIDYDFGKKLNSQLKGKEQELNLNIITKEDKNILHLSMGSDDLIFYMPLDYELEKEINQFIKTEKYIPQKNSSALSSEERAILTAKEQENFKRKENILNQLKDNLSNAKIYFNAEDVEIASKDIKKQLEDGFERVISKIYPYLNGLNVDYTEESVKAILSNNSDLFKEDSLSNLETEVLNRINRAKTIVLKDIIDTFSKRPYGLYRNAILAIIAKLKVKNLIDIKQNSTPLTNNDLKTILLNTRNYNNLLLSIKKNIDNKQLKNIKEILNEFIDIKSQNIDEIYKEFLDGIEKLILALQKAENYPFKEKAQKIREFLKELKKIEFDEFIEEIESKEDDILDISEEIGYILEFLNGEKSKIYNKIKDYIRVNQSNLKYLDEIDLSLLQDENIYKGNKIQKLNLIFKELNEELESIINKEKEKALLRIDKIIEKIQNLPEFNKVEVSKRNEIIGPILRLKDKISTSSNIDEIKQLSSKEKEEEILKLAYEKISELTKEEIKIEYFEKFLPKGKVIEKEEDVEKFIDELKKRLLEELEKNSKIII